MGAPRSIPAMSRLPWPCIEVVGGTLATGAPLITGIPTWAGVAA